MLAMICAGLLEGSTPRRQPPAALTITLIGVNVL